MQIPLCHIDNIPAGTSKQFNVAEQSIFVVHYSGGFFAYLNRCPHLGIELQWQPDQFLDATSDMIQCATHGALFLIEDGQCLAGPCTGKSLTAIACHVKDDQLLVTLPAPATR